MNKTQQPEHAYRLFETQLSPGERLIHPDDEEWPDKLNELGSETPPTRLYAVGRSLTPATTSIAIVGTRRPTLAGIEVAERIARGIAEVGWTVVSGLAVGIDAAAHRGALEVNGATVAVVGCGLDINYPVRNERLRRQLQMRGTILSEHPPGIPPMTHHFPARNRIIAGLCDGVVVVEGGFKSGALITARMAIDANRTVYAVPGSTRNVMSEGPNFLIKSSQAALITGVQDIFDDLANGLLWKDSKVDPMARMVPDLEDIEVAVLSVLEDSPVSADQVVKTLAVASGEVMLSLSRLEIRGFVVRRRAGYIISESGARVRTAALA
jgi:DNA processing protein